MMAVFFIGIGLSSVLVSLTSNPVEMAISLTLIGIFAAIYHPVGLAMVVEGREKTGMPLAINGVFGNMGVASAALLTGYLIDTSSWRTAFALPGIISIILGLLYLGYLRRQPLPDRAAVMPGAGKNGVVTSRTMLLRLFAIILVSTAIGGLIFQSTTFALPKVFDERLATIAPSATLIGWYAFVVFSLAAFAQLVVGYLVDRYSIRTVFVVVALLQAIFFALMTQLEGVPALLIAIAFMLVVFGQIPINDVLVGRIAKSEWRSRAYSLRYIVTFSVMASAVPFIAWVHAGWGFNTLFAVLSIAAMLIFTTVLFLPGSTEPLMRSARAAE